MPNTPKTITFNLSLDETNIILKHLGTGTHNEVAPLIQNIIGQAQPQLQAQAAAPEEPAVSALPEKAKKSIRRALKTEPEQTQEPK